MTQDEVASKAMHNDNFGKFMEAPMTKVGLSLIPPTEKAPEALEMLLRSAFDAGVASGMGGVIGSLLKAMTKDRPPANR